MRFCRLQVGAKLGLGPGEPECWAHGSESPRRARASRARARVLSRGRGLGSRRYVTRSPPGDGCALRLLQLLSWLAEIAFLAVGAFFRCFLQPQVKVVERRLEHLWLLLQRLGATEDGVCLIQLPQLPPHRLRGGELSTQASTIRPCRCLYLRPSTVIARRASSPIAPSGGRAAHRRPSATYCRLQSTS